MADLLKKQAVPVLLFTMLCSSVVYIYAHSDLTVVVLFTFASFAYSLLLYALYEKLRKKGKTVITTAVVAAVMAASLFLGMRLIETSYLITFQWLMEPSNIKQIYVGNIAALLLYFGFVLGSALYYFTTVRYRSIFVFLICMCPFSLYAKTFTAIPVIYIILISTLYFILMIMKTNGESVIYSRRSYIAFGSFVTVVVSAAAFLPKLENAPYREDFDELITGIQIGGAGKPDFSGFSELSSYSTSDDDETVIFTIYGDNPVLIKRQCFNSYDPGSGQWGYEGEADTGYGGWNLYVDWENPSLLSEKYKGAAEKHTAWINSSQSLLRALYTPQNMTSVSLSDGSGSIYRTPMDEFFVSSDNTKAMYYKVEWCSFPIDDDFSVYYDRERARGSNSGRYGAGYYRTLAEMENMYSRLMSYDVRRSCYKNDESYRKITELAASLTEGRATAYEKAKAIEAFFLSADFVYDKNFSAVDSSIENFIFNTKRGVCSDYATAMTLLCREAGLYSRYVEGFLVQKMNERGNYYVTSADSHAYVQVWLDGYGWTDFDPTSSNLDGGYFDSTFLIFGGCVLLIGLTAGGIIMLIPAMKRRRFLRRAAVLKGGAQAMLLFPELNRFLHEKLGLKSQVLTINELKERTLQKYGTDISALADNYERAAYGGKETEELDFLEVYRGIISTVKSSEKQERKNSRRSAGK